MHKTGDSQSSFFVVILVLAFFIGVHNSKKSDNFHEATKTEILQKIDTMKVVKHFPPQAGVPTGVFVFDGERIGKYNAADYSRTAADAIKNIKEETTILVVFLDSTNIFFPENFLVE